MFCCAAAPAVAQTAFGIRVERPLPAVLADIEMQFGVKIACKRFAADSMKVAYADFRIRPYSLGETLDNVLHPLGLVWSGGPKITIQPYEFYRRMPADGRKLLAWLSSKYDDRASWELRRAEVLKGTKEALALDPFVEKLAAKPDVRLGKIVGRNGYTTQNYALETLTGLYVCGTIYAPKTTGRHPLVISPSGHWEGGRYRPDQQMRMATFARMGAVAVDMDIFGWGESEQQVGREAHTSPYAMQIQVLWSKAVTDWIVASRRDVDPEHIAATGGSGGATHALMLAVVDPRIKILAPVVHLVSHFDGGCMCENGRPVTLAAGGTCMPEILAAACAMRPVLVVSDGGDWTSTYPELEYPFLRRIWGFYGAEALVRNVHLADEKHDYGPNKRHAVYEFFAATLGLDLTKADESKVDLQPEFAMQTFGGKWPSNAIRSRDELERQIPNTQ